MDQIVSEVGLMPSNAQRYAAPCRDASRLGRLMRKLFARTTLSVRVLLDGSFHACPLLVSGKTETLQLLLIFQRAVGNQQLLLTHRRALRHFAFNTAASAFTTSVTTVGAIAKGGSKDTSKVVSLST